jgi:hypothetical protein
MSVVLDWNGEDLPKELSELPRGRYLVVSLDELPELSPDEEEGLRDAMSSIRAGRGLSLAEARRRVLGTNTP